MRTCASQILSGITSPLHLLKSRFTLFCPFSILSLDKQLLLANWVQMKNEKYSRRLQAVLTALATLTVPSNFLFCGMTCILHYLVTCILQLPGNLRTSAFEAIPHDDRKQLLAGGIPYGYCCPFLFNEIIADSVYIY